ncbi:hypothetical protein CHELA20_51946 [Hyphomicrobiales bacterium]|nr:hypothetical protein CHELA41_22982 [Hyphomicrobiales bacterium]CAH1679619.1 hypothetical protein CHELA20_51946 [Hyphomicrobiales bacterium]
MIVNNQSHHAGGLHPWHAFILSPITRHHVIGCHNTSNYGDSPRATHNSSISADNYTTYTCIIYVLHLMRMKIVTFMNPCTTFTRSFPCGDGQNVAPIA